MSAHRCGESCEAQRNAACVPSHNFLYYRTLIEGSTKGHLKGDIFHYSFKSISQHVSQANKFTDMTAQAAFEHGKKSGSMKIFFGPIFKFIRDYFFNFGFLDGYYGFIICQISANATFLKYVKLRQLQKGSSK